MHKANTKLEFGLFECLALLIVAYSSYVAFAFAQQAPLDIHEFRQSQTALTAYWFTQGGFQLAYETPVGGYPWSIPFEFPIYQWVVAGLSQVLGAPLDATGRIVSHLFLLLCIPTAYSITRRLALPQAVFTLCVAITFSSPLYVYWGRTFMIETAALFFSLAAIKFFLDYFLGARRLLPLALFSLFAGLALLQKATTPLPVLGVLSVAFFVSEVRRSGSLHPAGWYKNVAFVALFFVVPLAVGVAWITFTDHVKMLNTLGQHLTSAKLSAWNWGTLAQRLSSTLWVDVIWKRELGQNLGGALGALLMALPFLVRSSAKTKWIALATVSLGFLPFVLFTNLHIQHDYYPTANLVFLTYAVAIALATVVLPTLGKSVTVIAVLLIALQNYGALNGTYMKVIREVFDKNNRHVAIGAILKRELSPDQQFVAFGNDWSSTFAYLSQRKSFTVPFWFPAHDQVGAHPERYLPEGHLGAVVACTYGPSAFELIQWAAADGRGWKVAETHGCLISTPQKSLEPAQPASAQCAGSLDRAEVEVHDGRRFLRFSGWTSLPGAPAAVPDDVLLVLTGANAPPKYVQTLKVPRLDVNAHLGIDKDIDTGFTRLMAGDMAPGEYDIQVMHHSGGQYLSCAQTHKIVIE